VKHDKTTLNNRKRKVKKILDNLVKQY
jgi:hypothetical protein